MELRMPVNAYYFMLRSIPCEEPLLLPKHAVPREDAAQAYVKARQLWLDNSWAEMDLDGSIRLSLPLARLLYIISHREAVLLWEREDRREYFVKSPADVLQVVEEQGEITLIQRSSPYAAKRIRAELHDSGLRGTFRVARASGTEGGPVTADGLITPGTPESQALAKLVALFYEEEVRDA